MSDDTIDTTNKFAVSLVEPWGREPRIAMVTTGHVFTPDDALNLAAWLVALADGQGTHRFAEVLAGVRAT